MDDLPDQFPVQDFESMEDISTMVDEAAINVNPSSPPAPKQPSYTPQFSSESSAILRRLNSSYQLPNGQASGDIVTANLKDRLSMPAPTKQGQSIPIDLFNVGVKQKQDKSSSKVDFTQSTIPFSWKGPLPAQPVVPQGHSTVQEARCSKCDETARAGHLVTCTNCLTIWHQKCHSPSIANEAIVTSSFTCTSCTVGREQTSRLRGRLSQQRQQEIDRLRQKRLSALPRGIVPAKPHLVGFGAGEASRHSVSTTL